MAVKLSISLPDEDVRVIDALIASGAAPNRSAAVHSAIEHLVEAERERALADQLVEAMSEWSSSGERDVWDAVAGDGV
ncbi:ribbon-helix-helix domain-containing protein [Demequina subtropica]|uniref:ribbon-helix-helix domain-containing protein n=1 Tax=Demequina subtropica TaxID=1638989 RepID=UPI000783A3BA|nr:ribbon-helix-helix domain-containing protein [Demequina subtropica]